jgi:hypothetical protein
MTKTLEMPERLPTDGPVGVGRGKDDTIRVDVSTAGVTQHLVMSEHNAWRVFGMLSLMLKIPLPSKTAKAIKL